MKIMERNATLLLYTLVPIEWREMQLDSDLNRETIEREMQPTHPRVLEIMERNAT